MMKLTPNDVRGLAKSLLRNSHESIAVWELCDLLEEEGYKVHQAFCIGACVAKDSGFYVMNNHIYKVRTMHHIEIRSKHRSNG